jgi:hypothetical protein
MGDGGQGVRTLDTIPWQLGAFWVNLTSPQQRNNAHPHRKKKTREQKV